MVSSSLISSTAASVGVPPTAAVGCTAADEGERGAGRPPACRAPGCRGAGRWRSRISSGRGAIYRAAQSGAIASLQRGGGVLVLLVLLRRRRAAPAASSRVLGRGRAARHGAGEHQGAHLAAVPADEQFGRGADQAVAGEREAAGVARGKPAQQDPRVDRLVGRRVQVPGEHHLAQVAAGDPAHGLADRLLPLGRGQRPVVPADVARARAGGSERRRRARRPRPPG